MEDGAKENTALNIQKPLEILVTDEDSMVLISHA